MMDNFNSDITGSSMQLYIGNKNYSSWSMRPWVLLRNADIAFDEVKLRFDSLEPGSEFKNAIGKINPAGRVPCLVDDGLVVWDTLAIAEYVAEKFPAKQLWPQDTAQRARARSVCAEMHSGFTALRSACMMNIEASLPEAGALVMRDKPAVRADVARIETLLSELLTAHGGPYLFGKQFTIADAYYAPVCMRFKTYALSQRADINAYIDRVRAAPGVAHWIADALAEDDFRDFEEPYRLKR
jgi:glutathione S-transferase